MSTLTEIWRHALEHRRLWLIASAGLVVFGVVLIAAGEIGNWGWTRLIGAGIISLGAVAFGVLVGWSDPVHPRITQSLYRQRKALMVLLAVVMAAPLLVGLVLGLIGLIGGNDAGLGVTLVGLVLALGLLGATAGAVAVGFIQALRGLNRIHPDENGNADGQGTP